MQAANLGFYLQHKVPLPNWKFETKVNAEGVQWTTIRSTKEEYTATYTAHIVRFQYIFYFNNISDTNIKLICACAKKNVLDPPP